MHAAVSEAASMHGKICCQCSGPLETCVYPIRRFEHNVTALVGRHDITCWLAGMLWRDHVADRSHLEDCANNIISTVVV